MTPRKPHIAIAGAGIQQTSAQNIWLKEPHDPDWVYDYDAWPVPLAC